MGWCREVCECFRCKSLDNFQIVGCKFHLVLADQFYCILFLLNGPDFTLMRTECHFYGKRTGSCSYIIADGIFCQAKFEKRHGTHLFLCHRCFASDKFFVPDPMSFQTFFASFIDRTDDRQRISGVFCQFICFLYKNLLIVIGQILSYIEKHITHTIFHQFLRQNSHAV